MSLHPMPVSEVPEATARVARAAFRKGNPYLRLRDELGPIFSDSAFAALFSRRGRPAEAPWRLALVTVLQHAEHLSDREAATAVRGRMDWKYLLGLSLEDEGFDSSVLSEFRSRLVAGAAETLLLEALLSCCKEKKLLEGRGRQRTDSTHVLARIRVINQLEVAGETLRLALDTLAVVLPEWLRQNVPAAWAERYGARIEDTDPPQAEAERRAKAEAIGRDGFLLLERVYSSEAPEWLRKLPALEMLRQIWLQQFYREGGKRLIWRRAEVEGLPPAALRIRSPHDAEARGAQKRATHWIGYKAHLSETCDAERPHLITHVETTVACVPDATALADLHEGLHSSEMLPEVHLVDAGYVNAKTLVHSARTHQVQLQGPSLQDRQWQARQDAGFSQADFAIDWTQRQVTCPGGHTSREWGRMRDARQHEVIRVRFSAEHCAPCPHRAHCTRGARRSLTLRPEAEYHALQAARAKETDPDFRGQYAARAGIEGTISQGVRAGGLRRARYVGLAKTHLQHVAIAAAINFQRLADWFDEKTPARTRRGAFARLMITPMAA